MPDQNHTLVEDNLLDPSGQIIFTKRNDGDYQNKYFFYSHDTRGSVSNIINPDGKLVKGYSYDEFGDTEERGDKTFKNSVKFTGAVNDSSTGLYYMNARFYNPSTARFLTQDSYTGNPYEPRTQHLYSYCANDPINYTDPTGHTMRSDAEDGGSTPDPLQTYLDNRVKLGGGGSNSTLSPATRQAWSSMNEAFEYEKPIAQTKELVNETSILITGLSVEDAINASTMGGAGRFFGAGGKLFCEVEEELVIIKEEALVERVADKVDDVIWKNGWRTPDGKFASPAGPGRPGQLAEQEVWDAIKQKNGWDVIEGRISVRNALGQLRVYDGAAISPSGKIIGLEVKSGSATKTAAQRVFDELLNSSPYNKAYGVGKSEGIVIDRSILIRK